ncbi:MAG: 2-oxo-3-hexenedioate decarboxylase [Polaribacter sp.]|jgi:2-oxo-3-hexenedioate decarboxylase
MSIQQLATIIDQAAHQAKAIPQLSLQQSFSETEAYAIQAASLQHRYERGEKLIGLKMGFTSKAKMEQMGVHDMIWGRLTDAMYFENGSHFSKNKMIHPRAEPEICFRVKKAINRELSMEEAIDYVDGIAAAIEIIDSRYENFKFSLEDVIADNCSSTGLIIGDWKEPSANLNDLSISLSIDGKPVHEGSSNAILGNPWEAFVAATRLAAKYEQEIPAGFYIMAGAATPAVYLEEGQSVLVEVEGFEDVGISVL